MSKELLGESKISCWLKRKNLFPSLYYQKLFPSVNYPPTQTVQEKAGNKQRKILETEFSPSFLAVALSFFFWGGDVFSPFVFLWACSGPFPAFVHTDANENTDATWSFIVRSVKKWDRSSFHISFHSVIMTIFYPRNYVSIFLLLII